MCILRGLNFPCSAKDPPGVLTRHPILQYWDFQGGGIWKLDLQPLDAVVVAGRILNGGLYSAAADTCALVQTCRPDIVRGVVYPIFQYLSYWITSLLILVKRTSLFLRAPPPLVPFCPWLTPSPLTWDVLSGCPLMLITSLEGVGTHQETASHQMDHFTDL